MLILDGMDNLRKFAPLFVLAGILPFIVGAVISPNRLNFSSQAKNSNSLRLWTSPSTITLSVNQSTPIRLYASYDSAKTLTTGLTLSLPPNPDFVFSQNVFVSAPFTGQILLGTFSLTPTHPGTLNLTLDPTQIIAPVPQSAIFTQDLIVVAN